MVQSPRKALPARHRTREKNQRSTRHVFLVLALAPVQVLGVRAGKRQRCLSVETRLSGSAGEPSLYGNPDLPLHATHLSLTTETMHFFQSLPCDSPFEDPMVLLRVHVERFFVQGFSVCGLTSCMFGGRSRNVLGVLQRWWSRRVLDGVRWASSRDGRRFRVLRLLRSGLGSLRMVGSSLD